MARNTGSYINYYQNYYFVNAFDKNQGEFINKHNANINAYINPNSSFISNSSYGASSPNLSSSTSGQSFSHSFFGSGTAITSCIG